MTYANSSANSRPKDWVGKCTQCNLWRTTDHTIINRISGARFCMFDGAPIHLKCTSCQNEDKKECSHCGGTGMSYPPTPIGGK